MRCLNMSDRITMCSLMKVFSQKKEATAATLDISTAFVNSSCLHHISESFCLPVRLKRQQQLFPTKIKLKGTFHVFILKHRCSVSFMTSNLENTISGALFL